MKKGLITILLIIASVMFISPINTQALSTDSAIYSVSENVYLLDETVEIDEDPCNGENTLFGDPNDPDSVAWIIQLALNVIRVVGPIIAILLSSVDFIKVIIKSDDEEMAKAQKKLITRLILAALLFLIPTIVQLLLGIFGLTTDPTCGIQ